MRRSADYAQLVKTLCIAARKAEIRLGELQKNVRLELESFFAIFVEVMKEFGDPELTSRQRLDELQAELVKNIKGRVEMIRDVYQTEVRMEGDESNVEDAVWSAAMGPALQLVGVKLDRLEAEGALFDTPERSRTRDAPEYPPATLTPVENSPTQETITSSVELKTFWTLLKDEVKQAGIKEFLAIGLATGAAVITANLMPLFVGVGITFALIGLKVLPKASDKVWGSLVILIGTIAFIGLGLWSVRTRSEVNVPAAVRDEIRSPNPLEVREQKSKQPISQPSRPTPVPDPFKNETLKFLNRAEAFLSSLSVTSPVQTQNSPPDFNELYWKWEAQVAGDFMKAHGAALISARGELQRRGRLKRGSTEQEAFLWKYPTPDFLRTELATVRELVEGLP